MTDASKPCDFSSLIEGYHRFRNGAYLAQKSRWDGLATSQQPAVMVIGCCDSRVDPAMIFDAEPGQIFVLRNVANLVPPFETGGGLHGASAAIEFAVTALGVRHIVVLGHGACGGVAAALQGVDKAPDGKSFIPGWISILKDARNRVVEMQADDPQHKLELEGIKVSIGNLRTFPFIKEREKEGKLNLHGTFFSIAEGKLHILNEETGEFRPA